MNFTLEFFSIYKKMDNQQLQLQGKADVFWEFAKDIIPQLAKLALLYSMFILKVLAWSVYLVQVVFIIMPKGIDLDTEKSLRWFVCLQGPKVSKDERVVDGRQ